MGGSSSGTAAAEAQGAAAVEAANIQSGAALAGAEIQAGAALQGASITADATNRATELNETIYNETVERLDPYVQLGAGSLGDVAQGSTIAGLNDRLSQILDSENFNALADSQHRSASTYLASKGLGRSGRAASEIGQIDGNLAMQIENQLFGRASNNVDRGQNAAANLGGLGQNFANSQGQLLSAGASQISQLTANGAAASAQGLQAAANYGANAITDSANALAAGQQADQQQRNQNIQTGVTATVALLAAFSDERLKENMQPVGKHKDLTVYEWDWKEDAQGITGTEMDIGYKAQEVQERYPECIIEHETGLLMIDYPKLNETLKAA
ncbi:MAG: tail fiber domain-containing protein [Arenicella sp.]